MKLLHKLTTLALFFTFFCIFAQSQNLETGFYKIKNENGKYITIKEQKTDTIYGFDLRMERNQNSGTQIFKVARYNNNNNNTYSIIGALEGNYINGKKNGAMDCSLSSKIFFHTGSKINNLRRLKIKPSTTGYFQMYFTAKPYEYIGIEENKLILNKRSNYFIFEPIQVTPTPTNKIAKKRKRVTTKKVSQTVKPMTIKPSIKTPKKINYRQSLRPTTTQNNTVNPTRLFNNYKGRIYMRRSGPTITGGGKIIWDKKS